MYLARERSKKNYVIHSRKHLAFRALRTNASIIFWCLRESGCGCRGNTTLEKRGAISRRLVETQWANSLKMEHFMGGSHLHFHSMGSLKISFILKFP